MNVLGNYVCDALKDGAYLQFKQLVVKKVVIASGDVEKIRFIQKDKFDHDYALETSDLDTYKIKNLEGKLKYF